MLQILWILKGWQWLLISSATPRSNYPGLKTFLICKVPWRIRQIFPGTRVFRPGISVKTGSSNHNYKSEFYEGKTIMSAEAGLFANIRATRFLTIQPQVLYETKGSQHVDGKFRIHAITAPVNLMFTSTDDAMVQTYFLVGGYFSYHFGRQSGQ